MREPYFKGSTWVEELHRLLDLGRTSSCIHFSILCYLNSETKVIKHKKKKSDRKKGKEDINDARQIAILQ